MGDGRISAIIARMSLTAKFRVSPESEVGREIVRLVPHWYEADCGPEEFSVLIGQHCTRFFDHRPLSDRLAGLLDTIRKTVAEIQLALFSKYAGSTDILMESLATEWLRMHAGQLDWIKLIKYLESVSRRTSENFPVALTLLIRPGAGISDITQPHLQKFFDRLAASPYTFTYLVVDPDLQLMQYATMEWSQVNNAKARKFYPEFLHPIHHVMGESDMVAHLTPRGDLIIMNSRGVLATKRKKKWRIYDAACFTTSLALALGDYDVAANLIELVFDLSYSRQGALLIYDPQHRLLGRISNPESILSPIIEEQPATTESRVLGQSLIHDSIKDIALGGNIGSMKKKRLLIELASIDGAVIFDDAKILAVGALIPAHPDVGSHLGARISAAKSAYLWGARPIAVSSDGDVTVHFQSASGEKRCDAVMNFL